jgi:hypothetical protein
MESCPLAFPENRIHVHHALRGGKGVAIFGKTFGSRVPPEVEEHEWLMCLAEIEDV